MATTPDPDVVQAIHNELSIHLFGDPEHREDMADQIARRLLRDVPPLATLDLHVTQLTASSLNTHSVRVEARPIEGTAPSEHGATLGWWTTVDRAPAYGSPLAVEIRLAPPADPGEA